MTDRNRQILLRSRPKGTVTRDNFEVKDGAVPDIGDGQMLVRNLYLSIDPTIRGWLERDTYMPAIEIGAVVRCAGAGVVVKSKNPKFAVGDRVYGLLGWQEYAAIGEADRPNTVPNGVDLRDALSLFGITGLTAYFGLMEIGHPVAGETVVVSAAAGATGSVVGQLAKTKGCRVVGIAGQDKKCRWLTEELGFDAVINYKTEDVAARLKETCPKGVDIYFDNVGGQILNQVLARLAMHARVIICGAISQYNDLDRTVGPSNYINLIASRGRMEGFLVFDYAPRFMEAVMTLGGLLAEGKIKHKVTVVDGLEHAPDALNRLFTGDHEGKLLVKVADQ